MVKGDEGITMFVYRSEELSKEEQYKLLTSSIVPRPIAWILTENMATNVYNLAPFSFFTGASNQEPLLTVAILRENGEKKDTATCLLTKKEGVIHIVEEHLLESMNETSRKLPSNKSELDNIEVTLVDSQTVSVPGIKEANIRLEVVLHDYMEIKNSEQTQVVTDLFILRVTAFHLAPAIFDESNKRILLEKLKPVGRLSGPNYGVNFTEIIELERP